MSNEKSREKKIFYGMVFAYANGVPKIHTFPQSGGVDLRRAAVLSRSVAVLSPLARGNRTRLLVSTGF